jgi:hypothetical protein
MPKPRRINARVKIRDEIAEHVRVRLHELPDTERDAKNELLAIWTWIRRRV